MDTVTDVPPADRTAPGTDVGPGTVQTGTVLRTRPRYEGANICTWIGFKHVNYLVEEAVLDHLQRTGRPAGGLYERYGLCVDVVDIDTRMLTAFHVDDVVLAGVRETAPSGGEMRFVVDMTTEQDPSVKVARARVGVVLRRDPRGLPADPAPDALTAHAVDELGAQAPVVHLGGADPVTVLTRDANAFAWAWRVPYPYCHFTERVQMSGYLRLMEEAVDLFLADRGVSIKQLLDEQDLIPVVPRSEIRFLGEARMEERMITVFTVEDLFKRFTYTARMDCYVERDGVLVPTATGRITHGYAVIDSRRDWSVVEFDDRLTAAIEGSAR